jgi:hypothetical protein
MAPMVIVNLTVMEPTVASPGDKVVRACAEAGEVIEDHIDDQFPVVEADDVWDVDLTVIEDRESTDYPPPVCHRA